MIAVSKTNPGTRYHQNPPPLLAGSRLSLWRFFSRGDETVEAAGIRRSFPLEAAEVKTGPSGGGLHLCSPWSFYCCLTMLSTPAWYSVPSSVLTSLADFVPLTSS